MLGAIYKRTHMYMHIYIQTHTYIKLDPAMRGLQSWDTSVLSITLSCASYTC